jgi:malate synthase
MTQPFMRAYSRLAIQTCHRRRVHAMGGMAAQIPIKNDAAANTAALDKVRADKQREVTDGHDGTWVAHPALVPLAREIFDQWMPDANQIGRSLDDLEVGQLELLAQPDGEITEAGLRQNVNVAVLYLEAWLRGKGCVPLYHLMEDAATAEISRTQLWQWIRYEATMVDGSVINADLFEAVLGEELVRIEWMLGPETVKAGRFDDAAMLLRDLATSQECAAFLTVGAYDLLDVQTS